MNSIWAESTPPRGVPNSGNVWGQALSLALLRRPRGAAAPASASRFISVALVFLAAGLLLDDLLIAQPRWLNEWALTERSFPILMALLLASVACRWLGRRGITLRVASVGLLALTPLSLIWIGVSDHLAEDSPWLAAIGLYLVLFAVQTVRWIQADAAVLPRALSTVLLGGALLAMASLVPDSPWWWQYDEDADDESGEALVETPAAASAGISAEWVWNQQPRRVAEAVAALQAQRPGVVDLYTVGVAGDGNESVFRNEIEYLQSLTAERLDNAGRMVALVNHPSHVAHAPIASVSNLRQALQGVAGVMDTEEDLLLLFITSHGSEDHRIQMAMSPLPLDPITPTELREMLDEAGIRWRVLVVSACYSGGFVESLRSPETLVITAARADRTSFGCGVQSEITWFGEAFLSHALNQTTDLFEAFRMAKRLISQRESEEGQLPSYPQIARGELIGGKLSEWQGQLRVGPPVAFRPR